MVSQEANGIWLYASILFPILLSGAGAVYFQIGDSGDKFGAISAVLGASVVSCILLLWMAYARRRQALRLVLFARQHELEHEVMKLTGNAAIHKGHIVRGVIRITAAPSGKESAQAVADWPDNPNRMFTLGPLEAKNNAYTMLGFTSLIISSVWWSVAGLLVANVKFLPNL